MLIVNPISSEINPPLITPIVDACEIRVETSVLRVGVYCIFNLFDIVKSATSGSK